MIRGAIFDMDGTLLDSMQVWEHAGARYLAEMDIQAEPGLNRILNDMSMQEGAKYLKHTYSLDLTEDEIIDGINRTILHAYEKEIPIKEGVRAFLQGLSEAGVPMTIATSSDRILVEAALKRLHILDYFQEILTCSEVGKSKREAEIFLEAARRMKSVPEDTWVFEDALFAAKTAKKAGFHIVAVFDEWSMKDQEALKELADKYVKTGADWGHHLLSLLK